jgi:dTDP-D-glucose 4,6-dehydratase
MTVLRKYMYVNDEYELGRKVVTLKSFQYVTYDIDGGQEIKNKRLVTSQV